jgi:sulfite exporter TauE/SafE
VFAYSIVGAIFGVLVGITIAGFQQWLSIVIGTNLVLSILVPQLIISKINSTVFAFGALSFIRTQIGLLFKKKSKASIFSIGFLPYGLVYIAVALAIASTSFLVGALYSAFFGLRTIPIMASVLLFGTSISVNTRNKVRKIIPVL